MGASMFLEKGTPDLICSYETSAFFLEDKVYPNKATKIQLAQIARLKSMGFYAWVLTERGDGFVLGDTEYKSLDAVFLFIKEYIDNARRSRQAE